MTFKVKTKMPGQRACNEKDAKGELCLGHLKRWYYDEARRLKYTPDEEEAAREFGKGAEIYRCERCHTLYRPSPEDRSTAGQRFELRPVNMLGDFTRKSSEK